MKAKSNFLKPRWSKIFSDLWDDKTRTGLVVASIAVGVFAIGMIITAFDILSRDINASFASVNPANLEFLIDPYHENLKRVVESLPRVKAVEGRFTVGVRARKEQGDWQSLTLIGLENFDANRMNRLKTLSGIQFPGQDEVVVTQDVRNNTGFKVGDQVEVELPDGSFHKLKVVGLVVDQTTARADNFGANAFVTIATLRSFGLAQSNNRLLVTLQNGGDQAQIDQLADEIKNRLEKSGQNVYQVKKQLSDEHPMMSTLLAIIGLLGMLGVLITVLSSSLIINMLNALMTQQMRQIGVMKLVGGLGSQILGMYLTLIVGYSLISLVAAIPLSALAGNGLATVISGMLGASLQGQRVVPAAVVTQVVLALLIPLSAGFFPVRQGVSVDVRQALSNYRPADGAARRGLFSLPGGWTRWIPRPLLLSFRNTFRKMGRLLLTIFTLTVAGAVFIAVFNVRATMSGVMDGVMKHFLGDVTLTFSRPYRVDQVERVLTANLPGVAGAEGWGAAKAEVLDENAEFLTNLSLSAPPSDTQLLNLELSAGRWLLPNEQKALVVADSLGKFIPNLGPGSAVTVKLPGQPAETWMVVGVFRFVSMLGDPIAYVDFGFLSNQVGLPNQAQSFRIIVDKNAHLSQVALAEQINQYLSMRNYAVESVKTGDSMRESSTSALNTLIVFLLIMAILTAFVGSIGLTGTMSINVLERTREIGVMRTIGAVDWVIMQSVMIESLLIGLITWVLAIGLSFPISSGLLVIIGQAMMGSPLTMVFTPLGLLIWLVIVVILSLAASILPARNAARLTINEVLAYE